jgi:hypothetical protein
VLECGIQKNKVCRRATSDLLRAPKALELSGICRMRVIDGPTKAVSLVPFQYQKFIKKF